MIPGLTLLGNSLGSFWVSGGVVTALFIFPLIENLIGVDKHKREVRQNGRPFEIILMIHALLMIPIIISICYRGMIDGNSWTTWIAIISTGITTGISGIIVAHELGHKKRYSIRWYIGRLLIFLKFFANFKPEKNFPKMIN